MSANAFPWKKFANATKLGIYKPQTRAQNIEAKRCVVVTNRPRQSNMIKTAMLPCFFHHRDRIYP